MSPRLAKVTSRSASGRSRFAFASVVVIRPCSNSAVARLPRISRSWAGPPPSRGPFVGVGMPLLKLFVLGEALVVVVERVVGDHARIESGRAVLEREAHAGELRLDLV